MNNYARGLLDVPRTEASCSEHKASVAARIRLRSEVDSDPRQILQDSLDRRGYGVSSEIRLSPSRIVRMALLRLFFNPAGSSFESVPHQYAAHR